MAWYKVGIWNGGVMPPSGTITTIPNIDEQTVDVTSYASNKVKSIYAEINSSATMDELLVASNKGKMYKYTGTTDSKYTNGRLYIVRSNS